MTENEVFEHISNLAGDYKCFDEKISHRESLILCNLIEEIQQYRAIGTVEEFKALKDINRIADNLSKMERIEFKALKEKNEPKKPYIQQIVKDFREHDCYECPNCDCFVGYVSESQEEHYQDIYCTNCGQKLDWQ